MKAHLLRCYDEMKFECITFLLFACSGNAASDLHHALMDQKVFKEYFEEWVLPDQQRWHVVLNNLNDYYVRGIVSALGIFRTELEYTLMVVDADEKVFRSLRNLTAILHHSRSWSHGYDEVKPLANFIWTMCTGWDFVHGNTGKDHIGAQIRAM